MRRPHFAVSPSVATGYNRHLMPGCHKGLAYNELQLFQKNLGDSLDFSVFHVIIKVLRPTRKENSMSVASLIRQAKELYPFNEVELFRMFNVDCTPFAPDEELPPEVLTVGKDTFYPTRGVKRSYTPLWRVHRNSQVKTTTASKQRETTAKDYGVAALRGTQPGSPERKTMLSAFYAQTTWEMEDGPSAFDIPAPTDEEIMQGDIPALSHIMAGLFRKHSERTE